MATIIERPWGYQLRVTRKLQPKPLWATFDDDQTAERYGKHLEGLLAQGGVPAALLRNRAKNSKLGLCIGVLATGLTWQLPRRRILCSRLCVFRKSRQSSTKLVAIQSIDELVQTLPLDAFWNSSL